MNPEDGHSSQQQISFDMVPVPCVPGGYRCGVEFEVKIGVYERWSALSTVDRYM